MDDSSATRGGRQPHGDTQADRHLPAGAAASGVSAAPRGPSHNPCAWPPPWKRALALQAVLTWEVLQTSQTAERIPLFSASADIRARTPQPGELPFPRRAAGAQAQRPSRRSAPRSPRPPGAGAARGGARTSRPARPRPRLRGGRAQQRLRREPSQRGGGTAHAGHRGPGGSRRRRHSPPRRSAPQGPPAAVLAPPDPHPAADRRAEQPPSHRPHRTGTEQPGFPRKLSANSNQQLRAPSAAPAGPVGTFVPAAAPAMLRDGAHRSGDRGAPLPARLLRQPRQSVPGGAGRCWEAPGDAGRRWAGAPAPPLAASLAPPRSAGPRRPRCPLRIQRPQPPRERPRGPSRALGTQREPGRPSGLFSTVKAQGCANLVSRAEAVEALAGSRGNVFSTFADDTFILIPWIYGASTHHTQHQGTVGGKTHAGMEGRTAFSQSHGQRRADARGNWTGSPDKTPPIRTLFCRK